MGHKCGGKSTQLFQVEVPECDETEIEDSSEFFEAIDFDLDEIHPQISINAMSVATSFHTMRINGHLGKNTIDILIDSGSTHNFLNVNLAKTFGCKIEPIVVQAVTVVDGNQL